MRHQTDRIRHEPRHRRLIVEQIERLSPAMLRIMLGGEDLADFATFAPDDHVKLVLPSASGEMVRRDYTPRLFDPASRRLTLDFALHDAGAATEWAAGAKVGDIVTIAGPKMSVVLPQDFDWWLLVGDEASLPAIARRLEEMKPGTPVTVIVAVSDTAEELCLSTPASLDLHWVHRPRTRAEDATPVIEKLRSIPLREGEGFTWIAGESSYARALRTEVVERRGHPRQWVKARGYWKKGEAGSHDKIED